MSSSRRLKNLRAQGRLVTCALLLGGLLQPAALYADLVSVRYAEGLVHGFLVLTALDGRPLADGDLLQSAKGDQVTSKIQFHFRDGSYHEEGVVFSQRGQFRLLSYHLVQKGPIFPHPMEVSINRSAGRVTVHYTDDAKEKVIEERLDLPADLANGLIPVLLKNVPAGSAPHTVSFLAITPKPQLVKLVITQEGEDPLAVGKSPRRAAHFLLKVDLGGVKGVVAALFGKQPPENHVWIVGGEAPGFVKSESPFYVGGPLWRIQLTGPVWPHEDLDRR